MEMIVAALTALCALAEKIVTGMLTRRVIEPRLAEASSIAYEMVSSRITSRRKSAETARIQAMALGYIDSYCEERGWGFIRDTEGNRHYFSGGRFHAEGVPTEGRFVRFRSIAPKKAGNCPKATTVIVDPERFDACYISKKPRKATSQAVCYQCGKQMTPNAQGNCPFCGRRFKLPRYQGFNPCGQKRLREKHAAAQGA